MSNLTLEEVNSIRQRVLAGEDIPLDVLQSCIEFLRTSRVAAPKVKESKVKSKAMKPGTLSPEKMKDLMTSLEEL
jgi:hypothetical protein